MLKKLKKKLVSGIKITIASTILLIIGVWAFLGIISPILLILLIKKL